MCCEYERREERPKRDKKEGIKQVWETINEQKLKIKSSSNRKIKKQAQTSNLIIKSKVIIFPKLY